jgi:membrane-bound lytic murein transglycosylase B
MVDEGRILSGVTAFQDNSLLFANIFEEYGVPAPILVSIWGIETRCTLLPIDLCSSLYSFM